MRFPMRIKGGPPPRARIALSPPLEIFKSAATSPSVSQTLPTAGGTAAGSGAFAASARLRSSSKSLNRTSHPRVRAVLERGFSRFCLQRSPPSRRSTGPTPASAVLSASAAPHGPEAARDTRFPASNTPLGASLRASSGPSLPLLPTVPAFQGRRERGRPHQVRGCLARPQVQVRAGPPHAQIGPWPPPHPVQRDIAAQQRVALAHARIPVPQVVAEYLATHRL